MSANQPTSDGPHESLDAGIPEPSRSSANPSSSSGEDCYRSRRRTYSGSIDDHQQRVSPKKKTRTGEEDTPGTSSADCSGSEEVNVANADSLHPEGIRRRLDVPAIAIAEPEPITYYQEQSHPTAIYSESDTHSSSVSPYNQPFISSSHSFGYPPQSEPFGSAFAVVHENQPSTSAAYGSMFPNVGEEQLLPFFPAGSSSAELLGNFGLALSPNSYTRNAQPTAESEIQPSATTIPHFSLEDIRPSVEKFANYPNRLLFSHTISYMFREQYETKPITHDEGNWIFGILAMIERRLTGDVLLVKHSINGEAVETVRRSLENTPRLTDLAVVILRRLSAIVDSAENSDRIRFSRQLYPFFYTLVMIVGSFKQLARHSFPSNTPNVDELLKQVVQEIVVFLEMKCIEAMKTIDGWKEPFQDRRELHRKYIRKSELKANKYQPCKVLKNVGAIVNTGFYFVNARQEFPTPDVLIAQIAEQEIAEGAPNAAASPSEPGRSEAAAPPRVDEHIEQVVQPIAGAPERPNNDMLFKVISIINASLCQIMNVAEPQPAGTTEWRARRYGKEELPKPPSIDRMLEALSTQCSKLAEVSTQGSKLAEELFQEITCTVGSVYEHLMIEKKIQKQLVSTWKKASEKCIEEFLASTEPLSPKEPKVFSNLPIILQFSMECHQSDFEEIRNNYTRLQKAIIENDPKTAMEYSLMLIQNSRIISVPPRVPNHISSFFLYLHKAGDENIDGRKVSLSIYLQKGTTSDCSSIVILDVHFIGRHPAHHFRTRIDAACLEESSTDSDRYLAIAEKEYKKRHRNNG